MLIATCMNFMVMVIGGVNYLPQLVDEHTTVITGIMYYMYIYYIYYAYVLI